MAANTSVIRIRRSYANTTPASLANAELAYSFVSNKLFIGNTANSILTIGGKYYTTIIDSATSNNTPSTLVKRDNQGRVDLGRITTNFYPETVIDVVSKGYVDNVLAASHGSIYFEEPGNTGYSNVVTTSEGVNITANNIQLARFRESQIYFDKDFTVTGNIYIQNEVSTGNITAQNIIALDQFYAGIATSLATPLPNLIAQFTGNTDSYVQVNVENIDGHGSSDYVATADVGTDTTFYTDLGIQGSQLNQGALKALDGYLLVQGNTGQPGGNLVIGTISGTPGLQTKFLVGGIEDENVVMTLNSVGLSINASLTAISINSPTIDQINNNVANSFVYTDTSNTFNQTYTNTANTFLQANTGAALAVAKAYTDASVSANASGTLIAAQSYTDQANTWLQANDRTTLIAAKVYTDTANTFLQANTGAALANAKVYTDSANTFLQANTGAALAEAKVYTDTANTFLQANDLTTLIVGKSYTDGVVTSNLATAKSYTDTANNYLQANTGSALIIAKAYTDTANNYLQANTGSALIIAKAYTDTANNFLQANTGAALAAAKVYTDTANTFLQANDSLTLSVAESYTDTANTFLQANDRNTLILSNLYTDNVVTSNLSTSTTYTDTANTFLQANDRSTLTLSETYTDVVVTANLETAKAYTDTANTFLQANDYTTLTVAKSYTDVANTFLQANTGAALAAAKVYTDQANTWLQANDRTTLIASKVYTDQANTWLQANDSFTLSVAESYTDSNRVAIENEIAANLTIALNYTNTANTFLQSNDAITLGVAKNYTDIAYNYLNGNDYTTLVSAKTYTDVANTWLQANDFTTYTNSKYYTDLKRIDIEGEIDANLVIAKAYTDTANAFNQEYTDTSNTYNRNYTLSANTWLQGNDRTTLIASKVYTDTANTFLQANDYLTWTTTKNYTDVANTHLQGLNTSTNNYVLAVETYSKSAYAMANSVNVFAQQVYDSSNTKFSSSGGYITGFANVSSNVSVGTYADFNTTLNNPTRIEGRLFYDKEQHALSYYNEGDMTLQIGQEHVIRVWNNSGTQINNGSVVYITEGSSANGFSNVALALSSSQITSEAIGIATENIPNGSYGYVTGLGKVNGLNTSLFTEGLELFLSDTTPGGLTNIPPAPPAIPINIGYTTISDVTDGQIYVSIHLMEGVNKTSGSILFARNKAIDEDPSNLFWDYENNSLGIGTGTPAANLHVVGSGLFTGNVIISGNLLVSNAQSITTTQLTVGGNTIVLNTDVTGIPTTDATIVVNRGSSVNAEIRWSESDDDWFIYRAAGTPGHILDSEETFTSWTDYSSATAYEKATTPIGADLSNTINELAKTANTVAYAGQAQALIGTALAQSAFDSSNNVNIYAGSAYAQANTANTRAYSTALKSGDTFNGDVTVPNLVANTSITINTISRTSVGAYTTANTSQITLDTFPSGTYRSAKYQIQMASGSDYHTTDLQVLHDGSTVWIAEYGEIITNAHLGTFDASISAGTLSILFTPVNSLTTIKFIRNTINI